MADLYANYAALAAARQIGVEYRLLVRAPSGSRLAHIAIHGGGIEPGTTEIADYLSGSGSRYYSFDGMLVSGNADLHLTSTNFDEPQALELVAASDYVISWHGAAGDDLVTYVGGLDTEIGQRIKEALEGAGFTVAAGNSELDGDSPANITNKSARAMGVQMELSLGLRQSFFADFTRAGRDSGVRTTDFYSYVMAVQTALNGLDVPGKAVGSAWKNRVAQPFTGTGSISGDFGIPALAPLTVDGMPLDSLKDALRLSVQRQTSGSTERFWSSPPRDNGDPVREVFEFSLSTARPVNRVAFSLARFPQRSWVQYRDADGLWRPLENARSGGVVQLSILDSVPAVVPAGVTDEVKLHPQHFGAGHWMAQMVDVKPVSASRFRVIMTRLPSASYPRSQDGQPVAYSLGVKDAQVSYRVSSLDDLPWLPQKDGEHTLPIAGSTDLLGSQVDYLIRRNRAENLVAPATGVWRCAPQPVPNAVVSLHLDLRTSSGAAQVIDRLYLDPVTSGVSVNIYSTEETVVPERFSPSDTPLSLPLVRASSDTPQVDSEGVLFATARSYLDIDNRACQFDPAQPFLLSMVVQPQFTSDDTGVWTILDTAAMTLWLESGAVKVRLGDRTVELESTSFGVNSRIPLAVAYDGSTLTVRTPAETRIQENTHVQDVAPPNVIRLGGPLQGEGGSLRLRSLFLARGRAADIDTIDAYWDAPAEYALNPGYGVDETAHTCASAVLRMDPSLITSGLDSVCPWGLIGGPPVALDDLVWTPVPGDFTLKKGLMKFRPIKARHLKLEFTNLQPLVLTPSGAAPLVETKLFPADTGQGTSIVASGTSASGAAPAGARVATEQGAVYQYVDANRIVSSTTDGAPYLPTEALYAPDPLAAQQLRRSGQRFPYLPLPATKAPRFTSTGIHRYHLVQMAMDTKVGYTVAISQVLAYLADPVAQRDTEQYVELFHDTAYLSGYRDDEQGGWKHNGNTMITEEQPPSTGAAITSTTFVSKRKMVAVQFAAQTSQPKQLVTDPDFDDPSLHFWRPVGDATIDSSTEYASTLGRMAKVVRGHAASSWGALESRFATWGDIEASDPLPNRPLWWEIENSTSQADFGGIESLRPVHPAPRGRLYAAARVYTDTPLAEPLTLQLVNGDGRIIAEANHTFDAAKIGEWYVGATINTAPSNPLTWDQVSDSDTRSWGDVEALGLWGDVVQDWDVDNVYDVRVRVVQQGSAGTGQWHVDSLAVFNDPIIWEITRDGGLHWYEMLDIKNNPRGVFHFPDLPANDRSGGTQLRWRATGYTPDLSVSSVVLRPWYATLTGAVPYQDTLQAAGAASSLADYYPPVDSDPLFQGWQHPIPEDWWLAFRQWMQQNAPKTSPLPTITLPEAVAQGTNEGNPPSLARHMLADAFVINR
jgi:phage replication-related protein YjqB (UPF0714/DUF867 family)